MYLPHARLHPHPRPHPRIHTHTHAHTHAHTHTHARCAVARARGRSIAGCRTVGRLVAGNRHGLLCPNNTTDQELQHVRNSLPDHVSVRRIEERLSALGNVIAANDYVALIHPDVDRETEEIIADTLKVRCTSHGVRWEGRGWMDAGGESRTGRWHGMAWDGHTPCGQGGAMSRRGC